MIHIVLFWIMCLAKVCWNNKFRTVSKSWDHFELKLLETFFSRTLFRRRKFDLKFCTFLHYPKTECYAFQLILFCSNMLGNTAKDSVS